MIPTRRGISEISRHRAAGDEKRPVKGAGHGAQTRFSGCDFPRAWSPLTSQGPACILDGSFRPPTVIVSTGLTGALQNLKDNKGIVARGRLSYSD